MKQLQFDLFAQDDNLTFSPYSYHEVANVKKSELSNPGMIVESFMNIKESGTVVTNYKLKDGRYAYIVTFSDEKNDKHEDDYDCGSSRWVYENELADFPSLMRIFLVKETK